MISTLRVLVIPLTVILCSHQPILAENLGLFCKSEKITNLIDNNSTTVPYEGSFSVVLILNDGGEISEIISPFEPTCKNGGIRNQKIEENKVWLKCQEEGTRGHFSIIEIDRYTGNFIIIRGLVGSNEVKITEGDCALTEKRF